MPSKPDMIYGNLPNDWDLVEVRDLLVDGRAALQTGPFGTMLHASAYVSAGTPVVAVKNIGENCIVHEDVPRVDDANVERLQRYKLKTGDILFGRKGDVERRALIRPEEAGWLQGSDCIRLRILTDQIEPKFVSYVFGTRAYREWILRNAQGATMPSLNQEIIGRVPLPLPKRSEQRAIVHILATLDDKIELNRRMNETLQAMSRAIFKSWFVDFDPVRAKAEGRQPYGMDALTAALFPNSFQDSPLGKIPQGWKVSPIGDVVSAVGGSTPRTEEPTFWGGDLNFCTPKDMASLRFPILIETERRITNAGLQQISSGLLQKGTVLLSSRAPIGYLGVAEIPLAINQGIIAMICDKELPKIYVLHWTKENLDTLIANANGTTFLEISKRNFRPIPVLVPSPPVLERFTQKVEPTYLQMVNNMKQAKTLSVIRDGLLPRLTSGETRIRDVEKFLQFSDA